MTHTLIQDIKYTTGAKAFVEHREAFFFFFCFNSECQGTGRVPRHSIFDGNIIMIFNPNVKDGLESHATGSTEDGRIENKTQTHDMNTKNM